MARYLDSALSRPFLFSHAAALSSLPLSPCRAFEMRLRIQSLPPLPDLKAWFIQEEHQTPASIGDLKQLLCSNIGILKGAGVIPGDVQLLLDDFELLNESPFAATLRDGDLLCIKAVPSSTIRRRPKSEEKEGEGMCSPSKTLCARLIISHLELLHDKKRKRALPRDKEEKRRKLKSRKLAKAAYYESDSLYTSTSTSSTSCTSSSPLSSSSSTSSSSSSEESESSSSSAPSSLPSKPSKRSLPRTVGPPPSVSKPKSPPQGPFVPPGFGKQTTHARNLRRKRLRATQAEQRAASILQSPGVSQVNALPLGERPTPQSLLSSMNGKGKGEEMGEGEGESMQVELEERRKVMMGSLGNKNKKKGFKQFLMAPVPKKIVFTENGDPVVSSLTPASTSSPVSPPISQASTSKSPFPPPQPAAEPLTQPQKPLPRLIPPSEIQKHGELPPNMFVTSVDVEVDLWNSEGKKKKKQHQAINDSYEYDYSLNNSCHGNGYQTGEDVTLSYGAEEDQHSQVAQDDPQGDPQKNGVTSLLDWNKAEQLFDNAPKISSMDVLKTAKIVGWKSLDLNPQTFTPEILLIAAELLNYSDDTLSAEIQRLSRPIDPDSGFSGFLAPVDPDDGPEEVVGEVEEYQLADILSSGWRVLRSS